VEGGRKATCKRVSGAQRCHRADAVPKCFWRGIAANIVTRNRRKRWNSRRPTWRVWRRCSMNLRNRDGSVSRYSEICLRRVWKVQRFSCVDDFHVAPAYERQSIRRTPAQIAELDYVTVRRHRKPWRENYVGPYQGLIVLRTNICKARPKIDSASVREAACNFIPEHVPILWHNAALPPPKKMFGDCELYGASRRSSLWRAEVHLKGTYDAVIIGSGAEGRRWPRTSPPAMDCVLLLEAEKKIRSNKNCAAGMDYDRRPSGFIRPIRIRDFQRIHHRNPPHMGWLRKRHKHLPPQCIAAATTSKYCCGRTRASFTGLMTPGFALSRWRQDKYMGDAWR